MPTTCGTTTSRPSLKGWSLRGKSRQRVQSRLFNVPTVASASRADALERFPMGRISGSS